MKDVAHGLGYGHRVDRGLLFCSIPYNVPHELAVVDRGGHGVCQGAGEEQNPDHVQILEMRGPGGGQREPSPILGGSIT